MGKLNKSKTKSKSKSKRKTGDEIPHISLRTAIQLIKGEYNLFIYKFIYLFIYLYIYLFIYIYI